MTSTAITWPIDRVALANLGQMRVQAFCDKNKISAPKVTTVQHRWVVSACAYYRPDEGIQVCLPLCQTPAPSANCRNWSWPGSVTDREPYGVLAHELGHHCDWTAGTKKGRYFSDYCEVVMARSGEVAITSYCPNPAEWFAEMFRLFVTNPDLLRQVRPKTFDLLRQRWTPVSMTPWLTVLGSNVPDRIVRTLINKGAKV